MEPGSSLTSVNRVSINPNATALASVFVRPSTPAFAGRVFAVLPDRLVDFWKMTRALDRDALLFRL